MPTASMSILTQPMSMKWCPDASASPVWCPKRQILHALTLNTGVQESVARMNWTGVSVGPMSGHEGISFPANRNEQHSKIPPQIMKKCPNHIMHVHYMTVACHNNSYLMQYLQWHCHKRGKRKKSSRNFCTQFSSPYISLTRTQTLFETEQG